MADRRGLAADWCEFRRRYWGRFWRRWSISIWVVPEESQPSTWRIFLIFQYDRLRLPLPPTTAASFSIRDLLCSISRWIHSGELVFWSELVI
jgi:hypothetical protein